MLTFTHMESELNESHTVKKNKMAEVEVNLFDTMLLSTEYTLGDTTYLKKLDWLLDEIEDIAYVTQVNKMI